MNDNHTTISGRTQGDNAGCLERLVRALRPWANPKRGNLRLIVAAMWIAFAVVSAVTTTNKFQNAWACLWVGYFALIVWVRDNSEKP